MEQALAEVEDVTASGADPAVIEQLKVALKEALTASGNEKFTSSPPQQAESECGLTWDAEAGLFKWRYFSVGDYDQNSEVGAPDIVPLAMHFGETGMFQLYSPQAVVDGDANGELGSADIVPIAFNFMALCAGYGLYMSASEADYPATKDAPNGAGTTEVAVIPFTAAQGDKDIERLWFEYTPDTAPAPGTYYWVRPLDGEGNPGTPSNMYGFPEVPGDYSIYYNNYTYDGLDRRIRDDYCIDIKFEGQPDVRYFNLAVGDDWVIQNVPLLSFEGEGVFQEVLMGFNLGEEAESWTEVHASASIDAAPVSAPPDCPMRMPLLEREVVMAGGFSDITGTPAYTPMENEFGGEVEDWACHGSPFPNQECGVNECVPAAVSNSLTWLQTLYGVPVIGKATDIDTMKDATGWEEEGCTEDWPQTKADYMIDNGYGITTDEYPDPLDTDHDAEPSDCEAAMAALRAGKDVEMAGSHHEAAVVGMARLTDGRYVIYVAHDTLQGEEGGTDVEKIIYDPAAEPPVAEGGSGFNGGPIYGFTVEYPDELTFEINVSQVDYTLDGVTQQNSEFCSVEVTYIPDSTPKYFNMTLNRVRYYNNVPLPASDSNDLLKYPLKVKLPCPTGIIRGLELPSATVGASIDDEPRSDPPPGSTVYPVSRRTVNMGHGRGTEPIDPGEPQAEFGDEVVDHASHAIGFPNNDCGENECVLAGVSNSLEWLRDEYGSPPVGKEIGIDHWKPILDWQQEDGTPEGWASRKSEHMRTNGYGVSTEGYPPNDDQDHAATAEECDQALQALKDGKDLEMNGEHHCAAVVSMAKLANGSYVIYVAHDTDQGADGGQCIEKVMYDPDADPPEAEGAWGFNGGLINGFVAEWVETPSTTQATFTQTDFLLENVPTANSEWGEVEVTYETSSGNGVQYLNMSLGGEWVMQNVPVRDPDPGGSVTLAIPFAILGDPDPGEQWVESFFDVFLSADLQTEGPDGRYLCSVGDGQYTMDSGEEGVALSYTGPTNDPMWWINSRYRDAAFHPWDSIVNQNCGKAECAPTAISNSLKMLKASNPDAMSGLSDADVGIGTMRDATGCTATGSPAGVPDNAGAWWNRKKNWMNSHENYPINTEIVKDKSQMDRIKEAIRQGKDVELRVPGHVVVVTGVVEMEDGTYVIEVAHDTVQGTNTTGTQVELVTFDPATGLFSGRDWVNGLSFTDGSTNGALFVVESVSTLNLQQTDYTVNGVTTTDSGWGEVTFTHTQNTTNLEFFNLAMDENWVVQNLPLPMLIVGDTQRVTIRFDLGVADGTPVHDVSYGYSIGTTLATSAPVEVETGLIDPSPFNMADGDTGGSIIYTPPTGNAIWALGLPIDWAFHDPGSITNQDCGENECAPTAVSNSMHLLQDLNPLAMGGLTAEEIGIDAMKPATDWGEDGAPAGTLDDPGSWWNVKQMWMWLNEDFPVDTQTIGDKADFGDVVDAIRDGKDVELRIPGHVVMVAGAMELPNGDYILWVAHDTDQGEDGGTVIEPVYYDSSENTFHGPGWIEGVHFSSPGDTQALFVVESLDITFIDFVLDLPTTGMGTEGNPYNVFTSVPIDVSVMHTGLGDVTTDPGTVITMEPAIAGDTLNGRFFIDPSYSGLVMLSASFNGRPALPQTLYCEPVYSPPPNSLFCWPSADFAEQGQHVTVTVFANRTLQSFQYLGGCRLVTQMGNTYVPGSLNLGWPGGAQKTADGIWAQMPLATDFLLPQEADLTPTELSPTTWCYDFFVRPVMGEDVIDITGALFNFQLEMQATTEFEFLADDGVDAKTYYENSGMGFKFWSDITNAGAPMVVVLP